MKNLVSLFSLFRAVRRNAAGVVALFVTSHLLAADPQSAAATGGATGPYFLFDGVDITAKNEGVFQRVIGVSRRSVKLQAGGVTEDVPVRELQGYRTMRVSKFSQIRAHIDKLRAGSLRIAVDRQMAELEFGTTSSIRSQESALAMDKADLMLSQMVLGPRPTDAARQVAIQEKADRIENLRDVMDDYARDRRDDMERNAAPSGFEPTSVSDLPFEYEYDSLADGLELRGVISAPHSIDDAFVAVTLRYVDTRQPIRKGQALELKSVGRIGPKPRKVTVELRNLPRGFHLIGCTINVYAGSQEVATNLSQELVQMTESQLYEHFLHQYMIRNRGATRPPEVMLLEPPDQLRKKLKSAALREEIYAQVDAAGLLLSLSADLAGEKPVSPPIQSVMRFVRFFPGLRDGDAIESRVKFTLSTFLE